MNQANVKVSFYLKKSEMNDEGQWRMSGNG